MTKQGKCHKCGDQEFRVESDKTFRLAVPWLSSLLLREVEFACTACGEVREWSAGLIDQGKDQPPVVLRSRTDNDVIESKRASIGGRSLDRYLILIEYPAVFRVGENVLLPTSEGNVQDASVVDRYGDPDLMADFAEEYLKQFRSLMPSGRLPSSLKEVMPTLLLLVTATELAVKAFWIRSEKLLKASHSLVDLYEELNPEHKQEVERRFAISEINSGLSMLGVHSPKVADIMRMYSQTYGGGSSVYMDARYYAEPTTMFPQRSGLRGANMTKGETPYPIFLPDVVRALIDTYRYYSGSERLRRLSADLLEGVRDPGNDSHGHWGLVPSSLGLVVVSVPQRVGKDAEGEDLKVYQDFRNAHPTGFTADWMYGGNTLLFYRDGRQGVLDGETIIDGLECRVWSKGRMGLHSRELNQLADALEAAINGEDTLGQLTLQH